MVALLYGVLPMNKQGLVPLERNSHIQRSAIQYENAPEPLRMEGGSGAYGFGFTCAGG